MFKRLRSRFLLMHMSVVTLLIVLFFGSVLLINYNEMERATDSRLDMMIRSRTASQGMSILAGMSARTGLRMPAMPAIWIATENKQTVKSIDSFYDMEESFYEQIVHAAYAKNQERGKLRIEGIDLKFQYSGDALLFIDITREMEMMAHMLGSFLLIALPLMGLILLMSLYFANNSIRPIEESFQRQKEFIADASHELKTPLATITANLEVLGATAQPEQQKWMCYIQSEVTRMSGLTSSLLYLTRMDYGTTGEVLPVALGKLMEEVWLPLEAVLFEKGISCQTDLEPEVYTRGDEEQIRKLIGILADNAVRYAAKTIDISLSKSQGYAVLRITNDGSGIPAEEMSRIWERFYRCDHSRACDGGYGLGLPMAKSITERHRGKITCISAVNEATTFTVKLPGL